MNVATALNRKYVRYAGVMLYSLAVNQHTHIDAFLLHSELTEQDLDYLSECVSTFDVQLHPLHVDRAAFPAQIYSDDVWSLETYFRLQLPDLLPPETDRLLYLDVDVIVNRDLSGLYTMPFGGKEVIATVDACGANTPEDYGPKNRQMFGVMYQNGYRYFCAGVTLFNMEIIRSKYSFQTYLDAMKAWDYGMEAPDQDILNWVHHDHVAYVDPYQYNLFARIAHNQGLSYQKVKDSCSIIHFAGDKPWASRNVHFDIEQLWWDYAKATPAYSSLLEDFLESSMRDYPRVENYILSLEKQNNALKDSLQSAMGLLEKLSSK